MEAEGAGNPANLRKLQKKGPVPPKSLRPSKEKKGTKILACRQGGKRRRGGASQMQWEK